MPHETVLELVERVQGPTVECFECFKEVPISQTEECNCFERVCKSCMPAHEKHERDTHEPDTSRADWERGEMRQR